MGRRRRIPRRREISISQSSSLCKTQCIISPENNASSWIASKSLLELLDSYMQARMMMMMESEMHQHDNNLFDYYTIGDFYMTFIIAWVLTVLEMSAGLGKTPQVETRGL